MVAIYKLSTLHMIRDQAYLASYCGLYFVLYIYIYVLSIARAFR